MNLFTMTSMVLFAFKDKLFMLLSMKCVSANAHANEKRMRLMAT